MDEKYTAVILGLKSIPGYTLEIFLQVYGLEQSPPSLVRPIE